MAHGQAGRQAERTGFEPVMEFYPHTGLANIRSSDTSSDKAGSSGDNPSSLAQQLTLRDPDLARIVTVWPALSEPVRRAILALVETAE